MYDIITQFPYDVTIMFTSLLVVIDNQLEHIYIYVYVYVYVCMNE